ncbi:hypothetical protein [Leptolyngbya iicbica]|uniref:Uncharacterized protein n=2 Tax=Cyanophyceae TaxID=3028117 RepID=A0A4Q7E4M6_9CYAN|nr:hypothetical protein [Leptolyngbya sp. LK]RZM77800.1 hypothetical protein DYY88_14590 [Leptolyngbya sp. LK]
MEHKTQKRRRKAYSTDRFLPVSEATPVLTEQLGRGWSRDSIKRKIAEGAPFQWIAGIHYIRLHGQLRAINVDAVLREIVTYSG